jgi:hypothetical protein
MLQTDPRDLADSAVEGSELESSSAEARAELNRDNASGSSGATRFHLRTTGAFVKT